MYLVAKELVGYGLAWSDPGQKDPVPMWNRLNSPVVIAQHDSNLLPWTVLWMWAIGYWSSSRLPTRKCSHVKWILTDSINTWQIKSDWFFTLCPLNRKVFKPLRSLLVFAYKQKLNSCFNLTIFVLTMGFHFSWLGYTSACKHGRTPLTR